MDIFAILIGSIILAVSAAYVLRPLRRPRATVRSAGAQSLEAQRDAVYVQIKELDLDHATGKVNDEDYARLRAELMAQATQILKQIDGVIPLAVIPTDEAPAPTAQAGSSEAEVEALIAARRKSRSVPAAPATDVAASATNAEIEAAIAARRRTAPAAAAAVLSCPKCGKPFNVGDAFCARCGAALPMAKQEETLP